MLNVDNCTLLRPIHIWNNPSITIQNTQLIWEMWINGGILRDSHKICSMDLCTLFLFCIIGQIIFVFILINMYENT